MVTDLGLHDHDHEDERRTARRRSGDRSGAARNLGIVMGAIALVGSIFTAGYNWRSVAILEAGQGDLVRKDVQEQQLRIIGYQLSEVNRQLEELRGELRTQQRR